MATTSASAPGRVEILGNHTDYNDGLVLAAAIDRCLTVSGEARHDGRIRLKSELTGGAVDVSLGSLRAQVDNPWANYPLGVVQQFIRSGYPIGGFEALISGDLPAGCGLASSAALEVATARFLLQLHGLTMQPLDVARLCQRAENEFVGVLCGLLDQVTCVFGRPDHFVFLDCRSAEVKTIRRPDNLALIIADTGTRHALRESEYNARRRECHAAAAALGAPSLRNVTAERLETARHTLHPVFYRRAAHIIGENHRVRMAVSALIRGDAAEIGRLMNASHESSRELFENSSPDLDRLVEIARTAPGVFGSRLSGGGFGGSTVTLVRGADASSAADEINRLWKAGTGLSANAFVCRIGGGVSFAPSRSS